MNDLKIKKGDTVELISDGYGFKKGYTLVLDEKAGKELWKYSIGDTTVYIHERDLKLLYGAAAANEPSYTIGIDGLTYCLVMNNGNKSIFILSRTAKDEGDLTWETSTLAHLFDAVIVQDEYEKVRTDREYFEKNYVKRK